MPTGTFGIKNVSTNKIDGYVLNVELFDTPFRESIDMKDVVDAFVLGVEMMKRSGKWSPSKIKAVEDLYKQDLLQLIFVDKKEK